ncbi:SET and MYND domain-containing protein 5 [Nymphon striatum]|nr:SET and MYND domain-containing protein 5 [Nymphon striatum]KAG1653370.1 SET and MYND domain-containing protein 5 [Nymphon striatum]KAG1671445.1 SET and MYND domain-containing protein 5 [Nymphon striatum]
MNTFLPNTQRLAGKGLFALQDFKCGDVIFVEQPLVCSQFLWNAAYGYSACDFCMRPLETTEENVRRLTGVHSFILKYPELSTTNKANHVCCTNCGTMFCSSSCKAQALNQYHKVLCLGPSINDANHPLIKLQEFWKHVHYPPETASIMLIARMIATVKQANDKEGAKHLFSHFCHATQKNEIVHQLLGDKFQEQLEELRKLLEIALYDRELHNWFTEEGFRSLIALIGTNGQGIGTSPLSKWVINCDKLELAPTERESIDKVIDEIYENINQESGIFINNEGSGLYPLQSSCNHNCEPNAVPAFLDNNSTLSMQAKEDIKKGDEICISYLDECNRNRSRHSRVKTLQENYLFNCECPKCELQKKDPDVTSDEEEEEEEGDEAMDS